MHGEIAVFRVAADRRLSPCERERVARLRVFVCRVVRFKDFETGFFLLGFGVSSFSAKASGWDRR